MSTLNSFPSAATILPDDAGSRWRPWIVALHLVAAVGLTSYLYSTVVRELVNDWLNDPGASHGLLVPPLALYAAWIDRRHTLSFPAVTDWRGLWLVAFACTLLMAGRLSAEYFIQRASLVILIAGMLWTAWGWRRLRTLASPIVLLLTMVPLPALLYNQIAVPLQLLASNVAARTAQLLGVTVYLDGNVIYLANISLGVAEACSGLRSLSSLVVLAFMLGYLSKSNRSTRFILLLLAVPVAIGANILRIVGSAWLADKDERFAMGFYHAFQGWAVFVVAFVLYWLAAKLLRKLLPWFAATGDRRQTV